MRCFQPHYPRVIYIVRDPRDVAVSFYHHNVKARNIPDDYPMASFVPRFIAGEFDRKFGSWRDNVLSWTVLRKDDPGFLMLRYEDLKRDTANVLANVVAFLDRCSFRKIDSSPEALQRTIELSSPERMRALEKQEAGKLGADQRNAQRQAVRSLGYVRRMEIATRPGVGGGDRIGMGQPDAEPGIRTGFGTEWPARASGLGPRSAVVTEETPRTCEDSVKRRRAENSCRISCCNTAASDCALDLRLAGFMRDLWLRDVLGVRAANQRLVPPSARSFVFVCFGNIMRSAMAEFLMRQALNEAGLEQQVRIVSAGLHASAGREAHPWAQEASAGSGHFIG